MLEYIILGIIQGLTEFFPVSSSAHLVIMQSVLGIKEGGLVISVVLHLGTVISLIVFFFKDILRALRSFKSIALILIVTLITGVIGVAGKDFFESLFSSTKLLALTLIITGGILILTKRFMQAERKELNFKDALILGLFQAIAIIPGISRSGITISTLLFRKIARETAFKFSFLVSIPAILGAVILEAKDIRIACEYNFTNLAAGFLVSLLTGLFSLWVLKLVLRKAKLYYFGYYCIAVAILTMLFVK
ncbi:MAG: undecaprenyl-diphosphate phosphatase [Candidatus Omnitrophota bacterium]